MKRDLRVLAAAGSLSLALAATDAAFAQKTGGILKLGHFDSPASMSTKPYRNQLPQQCAHARP
jgi:hypothetical protein